ncbi:MAG: hypothetical protein UW22_C0017G0008 [Candidatus Gottesmanbacteria bacterium GW2011_GWB1_44_11c]|uniref:ATP synthase gamma chain n=1 Tax=Candidatus Gottesmanbacteria bacterium GW2011_GWB1_44_11c TaxID=1618447 RepID=A0A0G1GTB9_9BACT|nr:MAG: hypothetical protein UW22_C0017G0008 [Candidatus Gottesmanbacteria bacterium GW2011_GWB1_44_11c]
MKLNSLIYQEQQEVGDVKAMVEVYQEIAAMRMQSVKQAILNARQYYESLALLVREVRPWLRMSSNTTKSVSNTNKTISKTALFFSANTGLYGDIIERTGREFLAYIRGEQSDAAVVGQAGKRIIESARTGRSITYFPCDDAHPTKDQIVAIVGYAQTFDHVEVFHGRFLNLVSQVPFRSSLTGENVVSHALGTDWKKTSFFYLFEPTTAEITTVIEGEVLASVIEQILHESNFSKFASRMIHLDRALEHIDERLDMIGRQQRRMSRRMENKKQLARLSGRLIWQT